MTIFKNIKNLIKKSSLHRKEQMAIMFTVICFVLSGIFLPSLKKELSLESGTISAKSEIKENIKKKSSKKTDPNICKTPTVTEDTSQAAENTDKSDSEESTDTSDTSDTSDTASTQNNEAENKNSEETQTADASTPSPDQSISTAPASSGSSSGSTSSSTPPSQSSSGSSSAPAKVWVPPVYKTVHHDAVYQTVKVVICNYCGAEFSSTGEFQVHKDANGG